MLQQLSRVSRELKRHHLPVARSLNDVMQHPVGAPQSGQVIVDVGGDTRKAGEVIWADDDGNIDDTGKTFRGVVIAEGSTGKATLATQGVVPVLIKGPITAGDSVGETAGSDSYVTKDGARTIGTANGSYVGSETVLVPVRLGAGGAAAAPCYLGMYDASDESGHKAGFNWGLICGREPDGFSPGNVPAFTIAVSSGANYFFAKGTANLTTLVWTKSEIIKQTSPDPPANTTTELYQLMGSATVSADTITLAFSCGNIEMSVCNLPLE